MALSAKVLLVDDERSARHMIRYHLKNLGCENIIECTNGEEALAALKKGKVDLIISDWYMPNMSGLEFFQKVQADAEIKDIPFIMATSESEKPKVIEALKLGVKHYVVKPVDTKNFEPKVKQVLGLL